MTSAAVGASTASNPPASRPLLEISSASSVLGWALPLYLLLLCGGFAFLRSPIVALGGERLSIDRAAFDAINAVTGTGFQQSVGQDELKPVGRNGMIVLIAGGAVLSLTIGGSLVSRIAQLGYSDLTIVLSSISFVAASALIGAATLATSAVDGAVQGIGAISNCGLLLRGTVGAADSESVLLVLLPLTVAGGLGVPVVLECGRYLFTRQRISAHTIAALTTSAIVYLFGTIAIALLANVSAAKASAITLDCRSAGLQLFSIDSVGRLGQWIMLALMAVGASPGGTGGGLKGTTPLVLWRGAVRNYRGKSAGPLFTIAVAWTVAFGLLVFGATAILLAVQPQMPTDRLLFLAVSAATNTGLSHEPISMVGSGLLTLGGIALVGRVLPMLVLWWCCRAVERFDSVGDGVAVG